MDNKNFECVKVVFSDYEEEIASLRREAWKSFEGFNPNTFANDVWFDDLAVNAIHWAVFDKEKIIASARLGIYYSHKDIPYIEMIELYKSLLTLPVASLNRLVVSQAYRGHHISQLLDKVRVEEAEKIGAKTIIGQAVSIRIKSLQKLGFDFISDVGSIKELPNIKLSLMIKHL